MSNPAERLLNNIKLLTAQLEQGINSNIQVQKSHPDRLKRAEQFLQLAQDEIQSVREEDEIGAAYWAEIEDVFPVIIGRINDEMTLRRNLDFIQATSKDHLKRFIGYVLKYGLELLAEVVRELDEDEQAKLKGVFLKSS